MSMIFNFFSDIIHIRGRIYVFKNNFTASVYTYEILYFYF